MQIELNKTKLSAAPNYHPEIEQLVEYSAGSLSLSHALCVSAHLEYCDECAKQVSRLNDIGAGLFDACATKTVPEKSAERIKSQVLQRIAKQADDKIGVKPGVNIDEQADLHQQKASHEHGAIPSHDTAVPRCLRQFIDSGFDDMPWQKMTPSIKLLQLSQDRDGSQVALSRVRAGGHMPHHSHTGDELTMVIKGSFSDETGVYHKGDFIQRNAADKHTPLVTNDGECICLMVLDAPIQFTGLFTKLLNPFLRYKHRVA